MKVGVLLKYCSKVSKLEPMNLGDSSVLSLFAAVVLLNFLSPDFALAQPTGAGIWKQSAENLMCVLLPGKFGAMISAFSGVFALVAAATGAYRGAWALLFVSIACFISKELVAVFFGGTIQC